MSPNFIYSTSYNDALRRVIAKINARKVDLKVKHLLIVPERYTLLAEKLLYEHTDGSFDVEALSLSRLFYRMEIKTPLLSREGAIMLIRGMLPSITLECFNRSVSHRGFCEKLYDAINDFAASGVTPSDIPDTSPKLRDLKNIYAEYLSRIEGRFVDSMGKLALIAEQAKTSQYLNNVHIYVANFDYVDSATRKVFDALRSRALSYTECKVEIEQNFDFHPEKYCGEGAMAVKEVAKRMRRLAYSGVDASQMAVIVGNADCARIKRIFTEFDLPCFIAQNKRLNEYPLFVFLSRLFACAKSLKRDNFIELSKNVYSGIDKKSADVFENYVIERLIDYNGFLTEFDSPSCEKTRKRLVDMVMSIRAKMSEVRDSNGLLSLVTDIFDRYGIYKLTSELFGSDSPAQKLIALISLMGEVGINGNFDFVWSVFEEGAKATKVSELPYNGGIIVGDPASFRGGKYKFTAIIGFDDGFLPQIYDDSSLLGDDEKALFDQMERVEQINSRYERELIADICASEYVFATYTQPSGMMSALFGVPPSSASSGDYLLDAGGVKHAVELLARLKRLAESDDDCDRDFICAVHAAADVDDSLFMPRRTKVIHDADKLFFRDETTSISQLQSYFRCPFGHFADYGLRLKKRDTGELSAPDVGSFLHLIVEKVIRTGDYSSVKASVDRAVDEILSEGGKYAIESNLSLIDSLKAEAIEAIEIYVSHLNKGSFKPIGQEIKFETELKGIKLGGKIDMADEFDGYIRLIDYKTGNAELKQSDIYYGKKIQLPLYMAAAIAHGYKSAAMFNFPLNYKWLSGKLDHRFSGFMLRDRRIAFAIDDTIERGESEVFGMKLNKSGELRAGTSILDGDQMDALIRYAVRLSENAVDEMKNGYIAASPCADACRYCDYVCLCDDKRTRDECGVDKNSFEGGAKDER